MKQLLISLLLSVLTISISVAQSYNVNLDYTVKKNYAGWKSGSKVNVSKIEHVTVPGETMILDNYFLIDSKDNSKHEVKSKYDGAMECHYKDVQDLWNDYIIGNVLVMIQKKGTQIALRNDMEDEALEFIARMKVGHKEFNDPYLENYIYSLVAKIAPIALIDGRPGNVNIMVLEDACENAFTFANGTIVLTTGLISSLHSEDELVAILSHEIAHFVLDHSVENVNAAIKRKKRAEFWAAMATAATAVAEGVAASKNEYYVPGTATIAMSALTMDIASQVVDHLGMNFNHKQEDEADEVAKKVLQILGYDSNALSSALNRILGKYIEERNPSFYFANYTHPALVDRISKLGSPSDKRSFDFEKKISFTVTNAAIMKYNNKRFRQVLPLVEQNIKNNVATADDYVLKANCLLNLRNDASSNQEALDALKTAKDLDPGNLNIYKADVIVDLRLNKKQDALNDLSLYLKILEETRTNVEEYKSDRYWESAVDYLNEEKSWANKMIIKVKGM